VTKSTVRRAVRAAGRCLGVLFYQATVALGVTATLVSLGGCYKSVPTTFDSMQPNSTIVADVNDQGRVSLGQNRFATADGLPSITDKDKLMRNSPTGGLIAVIGDDNDDFIFIGRGHDFVAQRDGVLFLGVNEGNLADNTGAFDVVIEAEASGSR